MIEEVSAKYIKWQKDRNIFRTKARNFREEEIFNMLAKVGRT